MSVLGYSNGMLPTYFSAANKFEKERQEEENIDFIWDAVAHTMRSIDIMLNKTISMEMQHPQAYKFLAISHLPSIWMESVVFYGCCVIRNHKGKTRTAYRELRWRANQIDQQ